MALDLEKLKQIKKLLKEIEESYNKLGGQENNPFKNLDPEKIAASKDEFEKLVRTADSLKNSVKDVSQSLESVETTLINTLKVINKSNIGLNIAKESYDKINSIAYQIQQHQLKNQKLSKNDIENLTDKLNKEFKILTFNKSNIKYKINELALEKKQLQIKYRNNQNSEAYKSSLEGINSSIKDQTDNLKRLEHSGDEITDAFRDLQSEIKNVEKETEIFNAKLGWTGHAANGIVNVFEGLGLKGLSETLGLTEAKNKMEEMAQFQTDHLLQQDKTQTQQKELLEIQEDINKENLGGLTSEQLKSGFGGKILKQKQLQLEFTQSQLEAEKEVLEAMNAESDALGAGNGKLSIYSAGLKSMANSLSKNFLAIGYLVNTLKDAIISTDSETGNLAKSFNLTYKEALNTRRELGYMAAISGDAALNTKNLQESIVAYGNSLGSNAKLNEKDLITMTKLVQQGGYQHSDLIEITKLSQIQGKTLEDNTKEILGGAKAYASRRGTIVNEKEVLKEVNKMSASLKLSLGGSGEKMAQAVVQAKMFGLTLEQAAGMASSLLQFESSIENELSAELLLGKDLNFEKARQLALNNDIAGAAEEIAKQVGTSADFANMNAIQQEAIAKAAGLTKDDLAQSLIDREAMVALNGVEGKTAKERFNNLVKEVGLTEAKKRLGDEGLANQFAQQSVQDRLNQSTEKFKEIFIQVAEPILKILSPLTDLATSILPLINILLQPIVWAFKLVADGINFAVEGAKKLLGVFTGTTKELGFWEGLLGGILLIFGGMKVISYALLGYTKLSTFLSGSLLSINKVLEASNKRILASKTAETVADGTKVGLGTSLLGILGLQNAAIAYQVAMANELGVAAALRAGMEQTILGTLVMQGFNLIKNVGKYILLTIQAGARFVAESATLGAMSAQNTGFIGLIAKGAIFLAQQIATAVAIISGASVVTLGIAAAIALAAGAAAYAFFSNMSDGIIPPTSGGGYGDRVMYGPEGAISFNNKDTIVAGTDLFKANDAVLTPEGSNEVYNSTNDSPKEKQPTQPIIINPPKMDKVSFIAVQ